MKKSNTNLFFYKDEKLFGNKRFLIVEQLSCAKDKKLRHKLSMNIFNEKLESFLESYNETKGSQNIPYTFVAASCYTIADIIHDILIGDK